MTDREYFEEQYVLNDHEYLKYCDPVEAYTLEREMEYNNSDLWLFSKASDGLEDDYGEESMP